MLISIETNYMPGRKEKIHNKSTLIRLAFLLLILFSLIAGSCSGRKNKLNRRNIIPEKELISILTDINMANGLIALPEIHLWFSSLDSISTYHKIIEKHGYSKENMDKTMKYYFIKNPKKLIKIYDQVLGILSEMESLVEKEALLSEGRVENIWPGREFISLPDPSGNDSSQFDITIIKPSVYTLTFSVTLFPDDLSVNPRLTAYSCHPDSIETGKKKYIETQNYIKDGQPHTYTQVFDVPYQTTLHIRGWFYNFDNNPDNWEKHVIVEDISLTYPLPAL
jgi:hypothetical protein